MFTIKHLGTGDYFHSTGNDGNLAIINHTTALQSAPQWDTWANAYKQAIALKRDGWNDYVVVRITFSGNVASCN